MKYKKLKPLADKFNNVSKGCLHCGFLKIRMPLTHKLIQSFGGDTITKNGKLFYMPDEWDGTRKGLKKQKTLMSFEFKARKSPYNDWRLVIDQPLYGCVYQRQGRNNWVLVEKNQGFA